MDIYENIILGNFLVGLGHQIGRLDTELPFSVNLLQQTPMDKPLGDVLLEGVNFVKIIEFKRAVNDDSKEETKLRFLTRALEQDNRRHLIPVSWEIHWYVETQNTDEGLTVQCSRYLDFQTQLKKNSFEKLVADTANELSGVKAPEHSPEMYAEYVHLLKTLQSTSSASTGALVLWATSSGGLKYVPISELKDLQLSLRKIYEKFELRIAHQQTHLNEKTMELDRGHELSRSMSIENGYDLEL